MLIPALNTRVHFQRSCEPCFRSRLRRGCRYFWPSLLSAFVASSLCFNFSCIDSHFGHYVTLYKLVCPCALYPEDGIMRVFLMRLDSLLLFERSVLIQFFLIFRRSGDVFSFLYARRLRGYTATDGVPNLGSFVCIRRVSFEPIDTETFRNRAGNISKHWCRKPGTKVGINPEVEFSACCTSNLIDSDSEETSHTYHVSGWSVDLARHEVNVEATVGFGF